MVTIPYAVWEAEKELEVRRHRRDFIMRIVILIIILLNNLAWLIAWTQYDYTSETETVTIDGGERGFAGYIGHDGDINYGEDHSYETQENAN